MCEVIERVKSLRGSEREVVADLVRELSVIYKERLFAEAGYSSLFVFCTGELGYSKGAVKKLVVGKLRLESIREKRLQKTKGDAIDSKETSLEKFASKKEELPPVETHRDAKSSRYIAADEVCG